MVEVNVVGIDGRGDDLPADLAGVGVRQIHVDREEVAGRQEDQGLSVGADGRGDVVGIRFDALEEDLGDLVDRLGLFEEGLVGLLERLVPVGRELLELDAEHALEDDLVIAGPADGLHHLADDLVAPAARDIGPQGLAPTIGKVLIGIPQLPDLGQVLAADRVAHPHGRVGIDGPDGQVLGHALDEPERDAERRVVPPGLVGMALGHDVVLERVDQLMADDVVGLAERGPVGQDDAALGRFRDAARPLP